MSNRPSIIITGANGFIGSNLVKHFSLQSWRVIAFIHNIPAESRNGVIYNKFDLDGVIDESLFMNVDYLIHCAYVKHTTSKRDQIYIEGTKRLLELSRKYKLKRNVFLSSMSSRADAQSNYGKEKFALEKLFNTENDLVIRPGLVLGDGGLFREMSEFIQKRKFIPLIDGGKQPLQTILIDDLILAIDRIFEKGLSGIYTIAEPVPVSYEEFYQALRNKLKVEAKFISVPYFLINAGLSIFGAIGVKLPITKENLRGLKTLKAVDVREDLKKFDLAVKSYKESLEKIYTE